MNLDSRPIITKNINYSQVNLTPVEAFLLSRIDGRGAVKEISQVSGVGLDDTLIVAKLESQGLIYFEEGRQMVRPTPTAMVVKPKPPPISILELLLDGEEASEEIGFSATDIKGAESDITEEEKSGIDEFIKNCVELSYYEMLDVEPDASARDVKRAYFRLSKKYHPDRYFRKAIGIYQDKLTWIFEKITEAYEVLSDPVTQREYASSVANIRRAAGVDINQPRPKPKPKSPSEGEKPAPARPLTEVAQPLEPPRRAKPEAPAPSARPSPPQPIEPPPASPPLEPETEPLPAGFIRKEDQAFFERLYRADQMYQNGLVEEQRGQWRPASSNFRLAIALDPANPLYQEAQRRIKDRLKLVEAEDLFKKAEVQESLGQIEDSIMTIKAAVEMNPTEPRYLHKLSQQLLRKKVKLQLARNLAERAAELDPHNVEMLKTLASIYTEAGLGKSALRAFERVLTLDKSDKEAKDAIKNLKKASVKGVG